MPLQYSISTVFTYKVPKKSIWQHFNGKRSSFQCLEVSSPVTAHGTPACIPCGRMETPDSEIAGLVRTIICSWEDLQFIFSNSKNNVKWFSSSLSFSGGPVTFDLTNDAPTLLGAKSTFSINLVFPPNQTVLADGQVVWAHNCTIDGKFVSHKIPK